MLRVSLLILCVCVCVCVHVVMCTVYLSVPVDDAVWSGVNVWDKILVPGWARSELIWLL